MEQLKSYSQEQTNCVSAEVKFIDTPIQAVVNDNGETLECAVDFAKKPLAVQHQFICDFDIVNDEVVFIINPNGLRDFIAEGETQVVTITSSVDYTIELQGSDIDWITLSRTTGTANTQELAIVVKEQTEFEVGRNATIVFKTKKGVVIGSLNVVQQQKIAKYQPVEYIESTGTQWIDTGILVTSTIDFEFIGSTTEDAKTGWVVGAPTWNGIHKKVNTIAVAQWSNGMTYIPVEVNEVFKIGLHGDKAYFNDVATNTLGRRNSTMSLFVFAYHHSDGTGTITSLIRLYSFKIWDSNKLIKDFIPVLDMNDVPCLYDKVTEEFYYNQGTGNFIAGEKITNN